MNMVNFEGSRLLKTLLSVGLVVLLTLMITIKTASATFMGGSIFYPSCDPGVDPATDGLRQQFVDEGHYYKQSCSGQDITIDNFAIKVRFDPVASTAIQSFSLMLGADMAAVGTAQKMVAKVAQKFAAKGAKAAKTNNVVALTMLAATMSSAGFMTLGAYEYGTQYFWIRSGDTLNKYMTSFSAEMEGDQLCVYASPMGMFSFSVDFDPTQNGKLLRTDPDVVNQQGAQSNCFFMPPPPLDIRPPIWSPIISPVCSNLCSEFTAQPTNHVAGYTVINGNKIPASPSTTTVYCASKASTPFVGIVMQCVKETFDNILFSPNPSDNNRSVFQTLQVRITQLLKGLLALYVILIGYQFINGKKKVSRSEFIWYFLKFALVWYFSVGNGMEIIRPAVTQFSSTLSYMMLRAAKGSPDAQIASQANLNNAQAALDAANDRLQNARMTQSSLGQDMLTKNQIVLGLKNCYAQISQNVPFIPACPSDINCVQSIKMLNQGNTSSTVIMAPINNITPPDVKSYFENNCLIPSGISGSTANILQSLNLSPAQILNKNIVEMLDVSLAKATTDYNNAKAAYVNQSNTQGSQSIEAYLASYNQALNNYNVALNEVASFGYNYCDYDNVKYGLNNTDIITDYYPGTSIARNRDMSYMRLWDEVDCKFMKYLGVGDYQANHGAPGMLLLGIAMFFTNAMGIPVFIIMIGFLLFFVSLIIRICHIFIMASIAVSLLLYIAPIVIPSVLFNFTKGSYDRWYKQVLAYSLQPIIMFAFMAFLFAAFDTVIFGGNVNFYPFDYGDASSHNPLEIQKVLLRNKMVLYYNPSFPGDISKAKCADPDTLGCIYQNLTTSFNKTADVGLGSDFQFTDVASLSTNDGVIIFISFIKMFVISFVLHSILGTFEQMSRTLVSAAAGGATGLSSAPAVRPQAGASVVGNALGKGAGVLFGAVSSGFSSMRASRKISRQNAKGAEKLLHMTEKEANKKSGTKKLFKAAKKQVAYQNKYNEMYEKRDKALKERMAKFDQKHAKKNVSWRKSETNADRALRRQQKTKELINRISTAKLKNEEMKKKGNYFSYDQMTRNNRDFIEKNEYNKNVLRQKEERQIRQQKFNRGDGLNEKYAVRQLSKEMENDRSARADLTSANAAFKKEEDNYNKREKDATKARDDYQSAANNLKFLSTREELARNMMQNSLNQGSADYKAKQEAFMEAHSNKVSAERLAERSKQAAEEAAAKFEASKVTYNAAKEHQEAAKVNANKAEQALNFAEADHRRIVVDSTLKDAQSSWNMPRNAEELSFRNAAIAKAVSIDVSENSAIGTTSSLAGMPGFRQKRS